MSSRSTRQQELWGAWRERRDARAFERLVRPELAHVVSLARRIGARAEEAEDALQDTLVQLAQERSDDPLRVGLRAWLCRRVVLRHKRNVRALLRRRHHESALDAGDRGVDPTQDLESRERVHAALGHLAHEEREAVLLRYLQQLDYREMGFVLGLSEGACRVRVHRGLTRLRERLGKEAVTLVPLVGLPVVVSETVVVGKALATATTTGSLIGSLLTATTTKVATTVLAVVGTIAVLSQGKEDPVREPPSAHVPAPVVEQRDVLIPEAERPLANVTPPVPPTPPAEVDRPTAVEAPLLDPLREVLQKHLSGAEDFTALFWKHETIVEGMPTPRGDPLRIEGDERGVVDLDLYELFQKTDRLQLGSGTFRVTRGAPRERTGTFVIHGSGMDTTTLISPTNAVLLAGLGIDHLIVRNLTFEGFERGARRNGELLDVRDAAIAIFERVRFGNGYPWAGTGAPVSVLGRALLAFDACTFDGAWKQSGGGSALGSRGEVLATFRNCLFQDLDEVLNTPKAECSPHGLVHFLGCRFENAPLARRGAFPYPVRLRNAEVALGMDLPAGTRVRRFAPIELAEALDLRFENGPVRGTVFELVTMLDRLREPDDERLILLRKVGWPTWDRPGFVTMTLDTEQTWHTRLHLVHPQTLEIESEQEIEFPRSYDLELGEQEPALRDVLGDRLRAIASDTPCVGVHLRRNAQRGELVLNTYPSGSFYLAR
ncbi:MAG: RNA polymerase sigma factor [Planctomycetes bacterium]|nr:RNA polymerase sigma factor [Planctomycetota bacterium]MCB9891813.1 RNA polymerase sigma factor [Planctomycetota bacterium]